MTKIGVITTNSDIRNSFVKAGCVTLDCDVMNRDSISDSIHRVEPDRIIVCFGSSNLSGITQNHFGLIVRGFVKVLDSYEKDVVFVSTEHVFSGKSPSFMFSGYREQDNPNPDDDCGRVFMAAEEATKWRITRGKTLIVRRSFLYTKEDFGAIRNGIFNASPDLISSPMYLDHFTSTLFDITDKMDKLPFDTRILNIAGLRMSNRAVWDVYRSLVKVESKPKLNNGLVVRRGLDTKLFERISASLSIRQYDFKDGIKSWAKERQINQS